MNNRLSREATGEGDASGSGGVIPDSYNLLAPDAFKALGDDHLSPIEQQESEYLESVLLLNEFILLENSVGFTAYNLILRLKIIIESYAVKNSFTHAFALPVLSQINQYLENSKNPVPNFLHIPLLAPPTDLEKRPLSPGYGARTAPLFSGRTARLL